MSQTFVHLGKITVFGPILHDGVPQPRDIDIWVSNGDPALKWEAMRLKYYPNYDGPPPTLLDSIIERFQRRGTSEKTHSAREELTL